MREAAGAERVAYWGNAYLASTRQSYHCALGFFSERDFYTAYSYLFISFNNLYCLLGRFDGGEPSKIRAAVNRIPRDKIDDIYTARYAHLIEALNDGIPVQFSAGPDSGVLSGGVINMRDYFLGKDATKCIAHVHQVAPASGPAEEKRKTMEEVAAVLLYTVRNNQFHAFKAPNQPLDERTLENAYCLLLPIVTALLPLAERTVDEAVIGPSHLSS